MIQQPVFPYKLYLATESNSDTLQNWRLIPMGSTEPNQWVWVIGTGNEKQIKNRPGLESICRQLGRSLAKKSHGLITGGTYHPDAVQLEIAFSFIKAFPNNNADIKQFQKIYRLSSISLDATLVERATVIPVEDRDTSIQTMVEVCDACILLGGEEGSLILANKCLENGKPVLPILDSGGAAKSFYANEILNMDSSLTTSIYGSEFDLKKLDTNYKDAIDTIIQFLDQKSTNHNPRSNSAS